MSVRAAGTRARHAILYDADCVLCRTVAAALLSLDRRGTLRPVALQCPAAQRLLPGIDERQRMASFHLVAPEGRVSSGGAALTDLTALLPRAARVHRLLAGRPRVADCGYALVAGQRSRLGALVPGPVRRWADRRLADV